MVVKAHFVRLTARGAKAAALHLRYIQRDGVERDGSQGVLYDGEGPRTQARMGGRQPPRHRPHAHIILRGVDGDGCEVRLDRSYISNGLRWRAQEIATEELGPRPERDILRGYAKEVTQERFTSLDRELERRMQNDRVQVRSRAHPGRIDESTLLARLEHLELQRLAERLSSTEWILAAGWQQRQRELGSRGDILKQMHAAVSGDPARYHILRPGQALPTEATDGPVVTGRVASKGLSDELKGAFYAVIETPTGRAYHVPLDARGTEGLRTGDIVSRSSKRAGPGAEESEAICHRSARAPLSLTGAQSTFASVAARGTRHVARIAAVMSAIAWSTRARSPGREPHGADFRA